MEMIDSGAVDESMEKELLQAFLQELENTLVELERMLIELESNPTSDNLTNAIFRSFHNMKGSSSLLGHKVLPEVMHFAESVLNLVRQKKISVTPDIVTLLLDVLSVMKELSQRLKAVGKEGEERYFALLLRLDEQLKTESTAQKEAEGKIENAEKAKEKSKPQGDDDGLIKVSKGLLEQIMLTVGNFMTVENRFQYLKKKYSEDFDFVDNCTQLSDQLQKMQQAVLKMQLSSVKTVFNSLHRVVRTTASETKKKVNFETRGNDTLIDRKILDQLGEPLMHMVRNACDHGIEAPEIRTAANKPQEGQVTLEAFYRAGEVFIQLTDDGAGLNPDKLRRKAAEKGIVSNEEAASMSDADAFQLIFRPGFSSAEKVTNISGRGVGMDVVKQAVDKIGGQIDIESRTGIGTTFTLRLPLSLSIVDCLEFTVSGQKYAVQQVNVEEVFSFESQTVREGLKTLNGESQVLNIRKVPVPILDLSKVFQLHAHTSTLSEEHAHYIVAKQGESRFALKVDEIVGPCSLVTQALPTVFAAEAPFSGIANRGDGSLLFQIDLGKLANFIEARTFESLNERKQARRNGAGSSSELRRITQKIIVFKVYENFTLPVHAANQIITIQKHDLKEVNGKSFFTLDNQSVPMVWLEEILLGKKRLECESYTVMVYAIDRKLFGMSLGKFSGIHRMPADFDDTLRSDGVMGSMVFEGSTHLMLDMHFITAKAYPNTVNKRIDNRSIKKVLLAEDDAFFRGQIVSYLRANEFQVDFYENGLLAKMALEDETYARTIDAIVSDIEMPKLDGIALLRFIKSTENLKRIPVVMLSAITTVDVIDKVLKAGAAAYVTKMQNSRVIQELKKLDSQTHSGSSADFAPTEFATERLSNEKGRVDRVVTFRLGSEHFAIRMSSIKEVSKQTHSAQMGGFPGWMHLVTSFRGKFIPVVNLRKMFKLDREKSETTESTSLNNGEQIILEEKGSLFCIQVDGLGEVILLSQLRKGEGIPSMTQLERHISQFVESVHKHGENLVCLVNTKALEAYCTNQRKQNLTLENEAA